MPFLAGFLALTLAWSAAAEVYKWVDEKGVVNYGSTPPPGRPVKELPKEGSSVSVVPAPPPPPPAAARNPTDERVDRLERALEAERASRYAEERDAQDRRLAAIAQCEENRGVDCDENPYQFDGGYGGFFPATRPFVHRRSGMPPTLTPLPHPKSQRLPARSGPAASHPRLPQE